MALQIVVLFLVDCREMENVKDPSIYRNPVILQSEDLTKVSIQTYLENLLIFFIHHS
jgi:hypothetical protein